jgi:DNA-binding NarL/FixJ family response regulator
VKTSRRIVVVDDNEWRRRGIGQAVGELGGVLEVAGLLRHGDAATFAWAGVDVVLVDAGAEVAWDRFPGVSSAGLARAAVGPDAVVVLLDNIRSPLIVLRAIEAGVDYLYRWTEVADATALERLVLVPDATRAPGHMLDYHALRRLGLSASSRPNRGLALLAERGLADAATGFSLTALSRRRGITLRRDLADVMRVDALTTSAANPANPVPSWRQLERIVDLARGASLTFGSRPPNR